MFLLNLYFDYIGFTVFTYKYEIIKITVYHLRITIVVTIFIYIFLDTYHVDIVYQYIHLRTYK